MAILTESGRNALAVAFVNQPLHLAWGSGLAAWDVTPPVYDAATTALIAELGRLTVTETAFVTPDDVNGTIDVVTGKFALLPQGQVSNYVYMRFEFDEAYASDQQIREVGVFLGSEFVGGLPAGQAYFEPADIVDPGLLVLFEYVPVINRSALNTESFQFVFKI